MLFNNKNNKGMHTLNATEGTITFSLIALVLILLFTSGTLNASAAEDEVLTIQSDYLTVQMLRSFSQTYIDLNGEVMTVAKGFNEYFSLVLSAESSDLTAEERRINARVKQNMSYELSKLAKLSIAPLLDSNYGLYADVYFNNKLKPIESKFICDGIGEKNVGLEAKDEIESLQLPAFFNLEYEQAGDYRIELSIRKELDIGVIM